MFGRLSWVLSLTCWGMVSAPMICCARDISECVSGWVGTYNGSSMTDLVDVAGAFACVEPAAVLDSEDTLARDISEWVSGWMGTYNGSSMTDLVDVAGAFARVDPAGTL